MDLEHYFSPDYISARDRFRTMMTRLGWNVESHPIDAVSPDHDEELTIDVGISPGPSTDEALVLSSGLHGAEGFFGSAVQLAILDRWASHPESVPPFRCVVMHALNPYGFTWIRRSDQDNIDLNRNFLLPREKYQGSPAMYEKLDPILNPTTPPSWRDMFTLRSLLLILRHGIPALKSAIAGGQYDFPKGLFFGGHGPSQTQRILAEHFLHWVGDAQRVIHFDYHTGLGPWATYKLIVDYPLTPAQRQRVWKWFGKKTLEESDAPDDRVAYESRGSLGPWCVSRKPDWDYLGFCAEFGTRGLIEVVKRMRAENQAHFWMPADHPITLETKRRMLEFYCPSSPSWRRTVLQRSMDLIQRAIACLTHATDAPVGVPAGLPTQE